ncbi:ABC transporter permease [Falsirhodobacter deserti]|uniref:ABC transporter permease n=1 Tax=Falsirhodobacter deserti TaxID=1365611 RepID=UPI000FE2AC00|nr:ABC transporter permease [Falsirhodobacter deserti]
MIRIALCLLALWQGAVLLLDLPRFLLPGPVAVARAAWAEQAVLAHAATITLTEIGAGFAIGAGLGTVLAPLLALLPPLRRITEPVLTLSQTIPIFAFAPLLTLWLGYGMAPKIAIVALIVFFPVASAFLDGLTRTPKVLVELGESMGATPLCAMRIIRIPAALPDLASGLRIASVYAPAGAVIGEWVGGSKGLGALMIHANGRMKTDQMFAALAATVLAALAFRFVIGLIAARLER